MRRTVRAIVIHEQCLLVIDRAKYGDKFFTLPGGGIDEGETPEQAVIREVWEECSIKVQPTKHVYKDSTQRFGEASYFLCNYLEGEPAVQPGTNEAADNAKGENLFSPVWLSLEELEGAVFHPIEVKTRLLADINSQFPDSVILLDSKADYI